MRGFWSVSISSAADMVPAILRNRPRPLLVAGALFLLALAPRLFLLGNPSMWGDESYSIALSAGSLDQILATTHDVHPPLYYLLLHYWLALGRSELLVRLPSALLGAVSVLVLYALARAWLSERSALLAAVLLAVSPLHVWYSQEARMYSLLTFFGVVSALSLSLILRRGQRLWWLVYVVSALAGLYTHYAMFAVLLGENILLAVWWLTHGRRVSLLVPWACSVAALYLGFLPWLAVFRENVQGIPNIHGVLRLESLWQNDLPLFIIAAAAGALILGGAAWLWLRTVRSAGARISGILGAAALGLYPVLTVISAVPWATSVKRQIVAFLPFLLLLVATSVPRHARKPAIYVLVILTSVSLIASYTHREMEDWRGVDRLVQAQGQAGDGVIFHAFYTRIPFDYYYAGPLPRLGLDYTDFPAQLSQVAGQYQRVWVVFNQEQYTDPEASVRSWLDANWRVLDTRQFTRITVVLYKPGGASPAP